MICFYLRIFPQRPFKLSCYMVMTFVILSCVAFLFLAIFQCSPISYNWDGWKGEYEPGTFKCVNITAAATTLAAFIIAQDLLIIILPMPWLYRLQVGWRSKIAIFFMFSIGIFILITAAVRLRYIVTFNRSLNPTWDYVDPMIWSSLEISVSLIVTSLPAIRVLINRYVPNLLGSIRMRSFGTGNGTSRSANASHHVMNGSRKRASGPTYQDPSLSSRPRSSYGSAEFGSEIELRDKTHANVFREVHVEAPIMLFAKEDKAPSETGIYVTTVTTIERSNESNSTDEGRR
jgi:hypothetical protein